MSFTESITSAVVASINTKVNNLVNEVAIKLHAKYNIPIAEAIQLWNEINSEFVVKEKIVKPKGEKVVMKTCPYEKRGGAICGKKCKGDFCSSHLPENIEKKRQKAAEAKAKKTASTKSNKKETTDDMPALEPETDNDEDENVELPDNLKKWSKKSMIEVQEIDSGNLTCLMNSSNLSKLLKGRDISKTDVLEKSGYPVGLKAKEDCLIIAYQDGEDDKTKCKIMVDNLEGEWKDLHSFILSTK